MPTPSPTIDTWSFSLIHADDQPRAKRLENAESHDNLLVTIKNALIDNLKNKRIKFGWEQAKDNPDDHRSIIQIPVTEEIFDWFFNARTGYRAQFLINIDCGLEFNSNIIHTVYNVLDEKLSDIVVTRLLDYKFNDIGEIEVAKSDFLLSLHPDLSKIWFSGLLIMGNGNIDPLPVSLTGPKIRFNSETQWAAPICENNNSWLDVKGAFCCKTLYQPKDPKCRAEILHSEGTA